MFDIILYQPEIPPNTGNIMRLCANTGAKLHLIDRWDSLWKTSSYCAPGWTTTSLPACRFMKTGKTAWRICRATTSLPLYRKGSNATIWLHSQAEMHFLFGRKAAVYRLIYWRVFRNKPHTRAHGGRKPQPQFVQYGCGGALRSVAADHVRKGPVESQRFYNQSAAAVQTTKPLAAN